MFPIFDYMSAGEINLVGNEIEWTSRMRQIPFQMVNLIFTTGDQYRKAEKERPCPEIWQLTELRRKLFNCRMTSSLNLRPLL